MPMPPRKQTPNGKDERVAMNQTIRQCLFGNFAPRTIICTISIGPCLFRKFLDTLKRSSVNVRDRVRNHKAE